MSFIEHGGRSRPVSGWVWLFAVCGLCPAGSALAVTLDIRPLDFGGGLMATGTITTTGDTADIVDWNLKVTSFERLARYTSANTPSRVASGVNVSADGQRLTVGTSPDGVEDGGTLAFRARNPSVNFGVTVADFAGPFAAGGQAIYIAGAAFDFLDLNQPNGTDYLAAVASSRGNNWFDLEPLAFSGGVTMYGSLRTDGQVGLLSIANLLDWDIVVDMVTEDVFNPGNSRLAARGLGLSPDGELTVDNPDGTLTFIKGILGGHLYGLQLADFIDQPRGQAGYYQGRLAVTTIGLNAPRGPWAVTGAEPINGVPEPGTVLTMLIGALGLVAIRVTPAAIPCRLRHDGA
jgi:hypothetical protein